MNNVSAINKAKRLTEEEVHEAADELKESGVKPSSIEVYRFLGRGSLTTITNFLKTWNQEETMTTTLPALIMLPETLKKSAEQLIIKVWAESQDMAEREINSQREALRQAEAAANDKIAEAEAFSEMQAKEIEDLKAQIEELKKEKAKDHDFFLNEEKRLQKEISHGQKSEGILETRIFNTEKQLNECKTELSEQKKNNHIIANENIELKTKLEATEKNHTETKKQFDTVEEKLLKTEALLTDSKKWEMKTSHQETEIHNLKQDLAREEKRSELNLKDNERLREKAAMLEGELKAWKSIKPAEKKQTTKNKPDQLRLNHQNNKKTPTAAINTVDVKDKA